MKSLQKLRPNRGFTFIEVIMTIVIVGIISIPLSAFIFQQIDSTIQSHDYTIALNLARLEIEKVNNINVYDNINSVSYTPYPGYNYDVIRTVSFVAGGAGSAESLKKIDVTVRPAGLANDLVTLTTYIVRNVDYGV